MTTTKLFILGATGYIGGEVLHKFLLQYPDAHVIALVRTQAKADLLKQAINGNLETVIGDLNSLDVIEENVAKADIVINAASNNHLPSLEAIKTSLIAKKTRTLFIQTSGAGVIADSTDPTKQNPNKVYSDVKDIDEINSLPDSQPHRLADKLVQTFKESSKVVETAIISPPTIFGVSNGFDHKTSVQIPLLAKAITKVGYSFTVYKGDTYWSHVHISDLGDLYVLIIEKFLKQQDFPSGYKGYYFAAGGTPHSWKDVSVAVSKLLVEKKLISSDKIEQLNPDQVQKVFGLPALFWGSNAKTDADLGKQIGWEPKKSSDKEFWEDIEIEIDYLKKTGYFEGELKSH
ncbi:hypothetical protein OGAPHI_004673 [Ogataea philodendri]|uniref:NAD(P)-binding domain-containing protein n=1 Tax=Ogataea philodendri TaxID=1378263 RepID=A0A9P8P3D9_9ASCO|nr:uncharacterized protein OGAPHI_004673 [Ogataea philodendri]KAH3663959.1 hypothetical protein OGAPHI_004673 [Ogataea philodendri]